MTSEEITGLGSVWVMLGPTAVGKTAISLNLAERTGAEIVSVDSMQVYRGMDIGTAKVSESERRKIPHHMIDVVGPEERFNAARFCDMAYGAIKGIQDRGHKALLVCGTPFYLKALLWGMFAGPGAQPQIRKRLRREAVQKGTELLHERLESVDPKAAANINEGDYKRIERALEVYEITGRPISEHQDGFDGPPEICAEMVGLHWPRELLYDRIEHRVDAMIRAGLLAEVRGLHDRLGPQARQAVGYKELIAYLDGETGYEDAIDLIKRNTRRFAKNQIGWFKRFPVKHWIELDRREAMEEVVEGCMKVLYN